MFKKGYGKVELVVDEGRVKEVKEWVGWGVIDVGMSVFCREEMEYVGVKKDKMAVVVRNDDAVCRCE